MIYKKIDKIPCSGDNPKTPFMHDGDVYIRFIPMWIITNTHFYLKVFGIKIRIITLSKKEPYFKLIKK